MFIIGDLVGSLQAPVSEKYDVFHNLFIYYLNISCPTVWATKKPFNHNTWMTKEIKTDKRNVIKLSRMVHVSKDKKTSRYSKTKEERT